MVTLLRQSEEPFAHRQAFDLSHSFITGSLPTVVVHPFLARDSYRVAQERWPGRMHNRGVWVFG